MAAMEANVGEVPMTQDGQGIPPPEMEPQIAGGMYAAATATEAPSTQELSISSSSTSVPPPAPSRKTRAESEGEQ